MADGFRWAYGGSGLTTLALATHGWFAAHAMVGVVLAPYVLLSLDLSAFQFGLIGTAGGVGAVVGAAVTTSSGAQAGHRTHHHPLPRDHARGRDPDGARRAARGSRGDDGPHRGRASSLYGLAMGMSNSHEMSYRQLVTPDELQARTGTTLRSLNRAVIVVVAPIAGILADAWCIRPALWRQRS